MRGLKASFFVTFAIAIVLISGISKPSTARAELYQIELKNHTGKLVASRIVDSEKTQAGEVAHTASGIAAEVANGNTSCGVFIQTKRLEGGVRVADTMVYLIRNSGPIETRIVSSNSALLAKQEIPEKDKEVFPKSSSQRSVSVEAEKLRRSCTVSVL